MLTTPVINFPTTDPAISTNMGSLTIGGTADYGVDIIVTNQANSSNPVLLNSSPIILNNLSLNTVRFYDGTDINNPANNIFDFVADSMPVTVTFAASGPGVVTNLATILSTINLAISIANVPGTSASIPVFSNSSPAPHATSIQLTSIKNLYILNGNANVTLGFVPSTVTLTGSKAILGPTLFYDGSVISNPANNVFQFTVDGNPVTITFVASGVGVSTSLLSLVTQIGSYASVVAAGTDASTAGYFIRLSGVNSLSIQNGSANTVLGFDPFGTWSFLIPALEIGQNIITVTAQQGLIGSNSDTITVIYDPNLESNFLTLLPTGVQLKQQRGSVKLIVPEFYISTTQILEQGLSVPEQSDILNTYSKFKGFNFYASEFPGGGQDGYTLLTSAPVNGFDPLEQQEISFADTPNGAPIQTVSNQYVGNGPPPANVGNALPWDPFTTYDTGNPASFSGNIYVSINDGNVGNIPNTSPASWSLSGSTLGSDGDVYTDILNNLYYQKVNSIWILVGDSVQILASPNIKKPTKVTTIQTADNFLVNYFSYIHDRTTAINNPIKSPTKPITEKNHYVITSVFYDTDTKTFVESYYSEELAGKPFTIDTQLKEIPQRTESDFRLAIFDQVLQSNDTIDIKPGTVLRDTVINPESTLLSRTYYILNFLSAAQSFATLLQFDDPDNTGTSAPVLTTSNKNNLRLALLIDQNNAQSVQDLIDTAFDKLASNVNTVRRTNLQSTGQITVYTKRPPDRDASVLTGAVCQTLPDTISNTASVRFIVLAGFTLSLSTLSNYYNPATQRYEFKLSILAETAGITGNVDASTIVTTVSGFDGIFGVVNEDATSFGADKESNSSLADRAELAFLSVDSGTQYGYYSNAIKVIGVERALVVKAGDTLMQRDLDPLRLLHVFGKVDIYIKGTQNKTVTDSFSLLWKKVIKEKFTIQSKVNMEFRSINPDVTAIYPIFKVYQVLNVTQSVVYDLTNLVISGDGNVIDLDETLNSVNDFDTIEVTYLYRKVEDISLATQPAELIQSATGTVSGQLTPSNFELVRKDDPLLNGRSSRAKDSIRFLYTANQDLPVTDSGQATPRIPVIQTNEQVVLTGLDAGKLQNSGIYLDTLVVRNGPLNTDLTYNIDNDYIVIPGVNTSNVEDPLRVAPSIQRVAGGAITTGQTVFVSYEHGETMNVNYTVNSVITAVDQNIQEMKHLCADVLVKSAQLTNIQLKLNVILNEGADYSFVDRGVRSNIRTFLKQNKLGLSVYQSDIIALAERVAGVSHVNVPIAQMVKKDGSQVIREKLSSPGFTVYQGQNPPVPGTVTSFKSTETLFSRTVETGGKEVDFVQVFENDIPMTMVTSDIEVAQGTGRAYITIVDTSATAAEDAAAAAESLIPVPNARIIVSPFNNTVDLSSSANIPTYTVTYTAYGEGNQAKDIVLSSIEYADIDAGDFLITYTYLNSAGSITTTGI